MLKKNASKIILVLIIVLFTISALFAQQLTPAENQPEGEARKDITGAIIGGVILLLLVSGYSYIMYMKGGSGGCHQCMCSRLGDDACERREGLSPEMRAREEEKKEV
ncbi:MAG: hypothetical protein ACLFQV_07785 [Vulcanimicrobiota bacterium]